MPITEQRSAFGRDFRTHEDSQITNAFYQLLQARYGRRAANAAFDAAEEAVTEARS
jgi:hypothetical protein